MNLLSARDLTAGAMGTTAQSADAASDPSAAAAPQLDSPSLEKSFLTMLTAELRSQDPLNPMDNSQMVTQLSQISSSQGISNLENLSQSQILALMGNQRLASAELIGKSIDYKTKSLSLDASHQNFSGSVQIPSGESGDVTISIKNQSGQVVKTLTVTGGASGEYAWNWDGKGDDGKALPNGQYSASVKMKDGTDADLLMKNKVKRVEFTTDGSTRLVFDDGQSADIQNVTTIDS